MSTLQEIEAAVEGLRLEEKEELMAFLRSRVEGQRGGTSRGGADLNEFSGVLRVGEDPLDYQRRVRGEW